MVCAKMISLRIKFALLLAIASVAAEESEANNAKTNGENESSFTTLESPTDNATLINMDQRRIDFDLTETMNSRQKELDDAVIYGIKTTDALFNQKEPELYKMGLILEKNHPASYVAKFGAPNEKALKLSRFGYVALEASKKIAETYPENVGRDAGFPESVQSRLLLDECPLRGLPRCSQASKRYRTADGTCNNPRQPWRGAAMLPLQRFMPPVYQDGIQSIRRSIFDNRLPSPRTISTRVHRDKNHEIQSVTLMLMQWGQFIDHDVTSVVKSRSFNGSIPRCCDRGGRGFLPPELMHPACLPIEVPDDDWFYSRFRIRCLEFLRSAPSTRIDCDLGWREQLNQVTPFIDASPIYGSDIETSDSVRTFRNGKLIYGRSRNQRPLNPPDPPGGEICRSGALSSDCFQPGDGRVDEQPGLTAMHTVWVRYHNKIATVLSKLNSHWSDEKVFQETRKIVYSVIQHITYREFLPIILGQDVIEIFELNLMRKGYYTGYDVRINPQVANAFSAAAYRFGHSMVQNSFIRFNSQHRPLFNNVTLHEDLDNEENIWSLGSVDRLILGLLNQPAQRRDEFVADELSNHLFQFSDSPFGMDLSAINIQRGRDHGVPPYTSWREPCGLTAVKSWKDLESIMSFETIQRFRSLYEHVDDLDLYSGGLAEKPLRGGIVGPTFACIIAQQFVNLRKGDRFWYENGDMDSSFTPAQLQQIRHVTLAQILCQTMEGIETIQPFVFLSHDNFRNVRLPCNSPLINNFDLSPWGEREFKELDDNIDIIDIKDEARAKSKDNCDKKRTKRRKTVISNANRPTARPPNVNLGMTTPRPQVTTASSLIRTTTKKNIKKTEAPLRIPIMNITTSSIKLEEKYVTNNKIRPLHYYDDDRNRVTYLFGVVDKTTPKPKTDKPIELNIKIQYFIPTTTKKPKKRKGTKTPTYIQTSQTYGQNSQTNDDIYPIFVQQDAYNRPSNVDNDPKPNFDQNRPEFSYNKPINDGFNYVRPSRPNTDIYNDNPYNRPSDYYNTRPDIPSISVYVDDRPTKKPYTIRPTSYYDNFGYQSQYDDTPFYTTQKPYRPTYNTKPSYSDLYEYNRPSYSQNSYNRDDPISELYSQIYTEGETNVNLPMKPTFGQLDNRKKPNKFYSVAHVEKLDDKLDFKTRLVYDKRGQFSRPDYDDDDDNDDDRFIKISSVKADKIVTKTKNKYMHTAQSKEGDFDLDIVTDKARQKKIRLVEIEMVPSEVKNDQWLIFNATEEEMPLWSMPDINKNISCSQEFPKPIKLKKKNNKLT